MKALGAVLAVVLIMFGLILATFGGRWIGLQFDGFFLQREANVRTEAERNNKAFVDGSIRELYKLQQEYAEATDKGNEAMKAVIKNLVTHIASELPSHHLDKPEHDHLRAWVNELRAIPNSAGGLETPVGGF